ncbi:MAG: hypothetical protein EAZ85_14485 [Bacteroidetes bacterium]|nr:MAG: hypothetical protein EAZ85_14485 [Bacteroidota bacterium]TAG85937.1 MAG: hypothetical protein EAZ20_13875 [Bacteroidota bacterium]
MRILVLILFIFLLPYLAEASKVKGKITNEKGEPVEFASIYIKGLNSTSTSNERGQYEFIVNKAGNYVIVFQSIGYKTLEKNIDVNDNDLILDVKLESELYMLETVTISASDRDKAYSIIEKAQEKRKYYLKEEIKSSQCRIYTKGLQRITKRPNSMFGQNITLDTGIVYLSESIAEVDFKQVKQYSEKMISSRVSGNNRGFSFNQASDAWVNLYENINGQEMSPRGVVSPIAFNAMGYYEYKLVGTSKENNNIIHKIQLIPKRKNAPAYGGFIYIMEGSWRIYSAELYLRKEVMEVVDSASVQQNYVPYKLTDSTEVWIPSSQRISFSFKVFGFEGNGHFNHFFSNYNLQPNFGKKHFKSIAFTVEKDANKRDDKYWEELRPLPLSVEEKKDYKRRDSLQIIKESKPYQDSLDKKRNKFRPLQILFGYNYSHGFSKTRFSIPGLFSVVLYNTVEGLALNFAPNFRKTYENRRFFTLEPTIRYGFSNQKWQGKLGGAFYFKPQKNGFFTVEGGQFIEQFSRQNSITPFLNSVYTLLDEQNFLKIYEKAYGRFGFAHDITPGIRFSGLTEYAERRELQNTALDYKWRDVQGREFSSNIPQTFAETPTLATNSTAWYVGGTMTFNFGAKYAVYPDRKFTIDSKYPTIRLSYRKGLKMAGSDVDYDFMSLNITDDYNLGVLGKLSLEVETGKFLTNNSMGFMDYRHFLGNQTLALKKDAGSFQLLDYYSHSTNREYIKAHFEQNFGGFITNSIPLLKKLKPNLVLNGNYLYTPTLQSYFEGGVGLETMYLSVHYFRSWDTYMPQNQGIRLGFIF